MMVVDGMGGHAHGARAAEVTVSDAQGVLLPRCRCPCSIRRASSRCRSARAHDRVVQLGRRRRARPQAARDLRRVPRAGRRRVLGARRRQPRLSAARRRACATRTRDHSHVELLLREGLDRREARRGRTRCATSSNAASGGDVPLPDMTHDRAQTLERRRHAAASAPTGSGRARRRRHRRASRATARRRSREPALASPSARSRATRRTATTRARGGACAGSAERQLRAATHRAAERTRAR